MDEDEEEGEGTECLTAIDSLDPLLSTQPVDNGRFNVFLPRG